MYIKQTAEANTYDVFLGEGWTNWSRVKIKEDGTANVLKGLNLNHHFLSHIQQAISTIFYSDLRSKKKNARIN